MSSDGFGLYISPCGCHADSAIGSKEAIVIGKTHPTLQDKADRLIFYSNLTQYHDFYQVLSFHQIEPESIDPVEYKKFLSNAAQLRATYAARLAEEEARKAEEIRRKAAEARKKFLEERDGK